MLDRIAYLLHIKKPLVTRGFLSASGATVPTNGTDGYQTGCIFQHTDGSAGGVLYINEGSVTSSDFNAVAGGTTVVLDGASTDAISITGTYERGINMSSFTPGTTTDGVAIRIGSGIGSSAMALPTGGRGIAAYFRSATVSGSITGMRLRGVADPASGVTTALDTFLCQASVVATKDATTVNSALIEFTPKGTNVIGTARGLLVNLDSAAAVTISTAQMVAHLRLHTRGDETMSGTDDILLLQNEAVGGNGRQIDSYIRMLPTGMSGGILSAGYLIDGGVDADLLATAVLLLPDDGTICEASAAGTGDAGGADFVGFIKVVIGTTDMYIPLLTGTPAAIFQ